MKPTKTKRNHVVSSLFSRAALVGAALSLAAAGQWAHAGETATVTETETLKTTSPIADWWNGKYATGNWFGARDVLEDHGLKFNVDWKANFLWNVDGGIQNGFGYDDEWKFKGLLDVAKLTGVDALQGLSVYSDLRYRGGAGINKITGVNGQFAASPFQGSKLWRFQNVYLTYTTPELFGIKELFTISGGWQNPSDIFLKQPESKWLVNNTFNTNRGVSANGIGWGGGYAAWGGYAKIKPTDWYYLQSGLYMAIPDANSTSNHGLFFQGRKPADRNGLYWLIESAFTPKIGPSKLPGKYAAGFIYWGVENTSFNGEAYDQRLLFYWQADQMLFRESSPEEPVVLGKGASDGKGVADSKSFKAPVSTAKPKLNEQGLYFFSQVNFSPKYNNVQPFYFQTGLQYRGLIPTRDNDMISFAMAYGNYSFYNINSLQEDGVTNQPNYSGVLEFDYRFQINQWAYVQPVVQYLFRPNGVSLLNNATVVGFQLGVSF